MKYKHNNKKFYTLSGNMSTLENFTTGVFIVNFEHISHLVLVFLLLPLNR